MNLANKIHHDPGFTKKLNYFDEMGAYPNAEQLNSFNG